MNLTVTSLAQPTNTPPRVQLTVHDTDHTSPAAAVHLMRVTADGARTAVRVQGGGAFPLGDDGAGGRVGTTWDYEAPFGQPVTYTTTEAPVTASAATTLAVALPWLLHLGNPSLSQPLDFRSGSFAEVTNDVAAAVLQPANRATPVAVTDGQRKSDAGTFTVAADTPTQLAALEQLLADVSPLLLNVPPGLGIGVPTNYVHIGATTLRRRSDIGDDASRDLVMPYRVVTVPVGGVLSQRTFTDLATEASSFRALSTKYTSFRQMTIGS